MEINAKTVGWRNRDGIWSKNIIFFGILRFCDVLVVGSGRKTSSFWEYCDFMMFWRWERVEKHHFFVNIMK